MELNGQLQDPEMTLCEVGGGTCAHGNRSTFSSYVQETDLQHTKEALDVLSYALQLLTPPDASIFERAG